MTDIGVRLAGPEDIAKVAALRAQWTGAISDPEFERRVRDWLVAEGQRRLVWLASLGDAPAGLASLLEYHRMPGRTGLRPAGATSATCSSGRTCATAASDPPSS